jgi:hypothetical protein
MLRLFLFLVVRIAHSQLRIRVNLRFAFVTPVTAAGEANHIAGPPDS